MTIDQILSFFVPKDVAFSPLFTEDVKNLTNGAKLLNKLMLSKTEDHDSITKEIIFYFQDKNQNYYIYIAFDPKFVYSRFNDYFKQNGFKYLGLLCTTKEELDADKFGI